MNDNVLKRDPASRSFHRRVDQRLLWMDSERFVLKSKFGFSKISLPIRLLDLQVPLPKQRVTSLSSIPFWAIDKPDILGDCSSSARCSTRLLWVFLPTRQVASLVTDIFFEKNLATHVGPLKRGKSKGCVTSTSAILSEKFLKSKMSSRIRCLFLHPLYHVFSEDLKTKINKESISPAAPIGIVG